MYTTIQRRRIGADGRQQVRERAEREFFPKVREAPGLIGFYLVADDEQGMTVAISVWQDKASAEAFQSQIEAWGQVLEGMGARRESVNRGETVVEITPQR